MPRDAKGVGQVFVPTGSFLMGSDDATIQELKALDSERPQHVVRLTEGYWIDKHEVTKGSGS